MAPTNQLTLGYEFSLARNLIQQGQFDESRRRLEEVVSLNHQQLGSNEWFSLDSGYWLGRAYEATGQPVLARDLYDRILPLMLPSLPSDASQFCSIGIADFFVRQRDYPRAAAAFRSIHERLSRLPPRGSEMFERGLRVVAGAQGWPAAAEFCRRYFDCAPESALSWLLKAWVFRSVGDEANYAAVVRQVLTSSQPFADPDQHVPLEIAAMGPVTFSLSERDTVLRLIAALETSVPLQNANTLFWRRRALAHMHLRLGNAPAALRTLGTVPERVESDPYALFIKAACLQRLDELADAREVFERATALSDQQLPQPLSATERFLTPWQLYQHLVMRRETEALLARRKEGARR